MRLGYVHVRGRNEPLGTSKLNRRAVAAAALPGVTRSSADHLVWVHVKYGELPSIIMSGVLGLLMAFVAYGRMVLKPLS